MLKYNIFFRLSFAVFVTIYNAIGKQFWRYMDKLRKNEIICLKIESINNLGFGVAKYNGMVVFVSGAVTGDMVNAKVIKVNSTYAVARCESFIKKSDIRTSPSCKNTSCGGCTYREISYEAELALKEEYVRHAFAKSGLKVNVAAIESNGKTCEYRNKAQYPVGENANGITIGFFAPKSHRITEAASCPLQPKIFSDIVNELRSAFEKYKIKPYDEENQTGIIRHIYLRRGEATGEISVVLVVTKREIPHIEEIADELLRKYPKAVSFSLNINSQKTNVICSDEYVLLRGSNYIEDVLCGKKLRITPASFYQVNHDMTERLYAKARELSDISNDSVVLDLYCGIGSIGITCAYNAGRLVGIEIVKSAVECAKENAALNGIENAEFYCADAKDAKSLFSAASKDGKPFMPDTVFLDPPRKGCDNTLIDYICNELEVKTIVYISCNPDTLARDVALFCKNGYTHKAAYPFDLFPRTGHVETVIKLSKSYRT